MWPFLSNRIEPTVIELSPLSPPHGIVLRHFDGLRLDDLEMIMEKIGVTVIDDLPAYITAHPMVPKYYVSSPSFVGILKVCHFIDMFNFIWLILYFALQMQANCRNLTVTGVNLLSCCIKMLYLKGPDGLVNQGLINLQKMVWMTMVHVLRFGIFNLGMHTILILDIFWKFACPHLTGYAENIRFSHKWLFLYFNRE